MIDRFFYLVGGVVAVLMVAVPVLMLAVRAMKPQAVRFMLFARQHAFAAMLLLVVGGVFGIYGSTKSSEYYIDVRNYSGTYDGQPHAANVTVYEWGYPCMDYVEYALALSGPYYYSNPPAFTDAGTYTVYYSAFKMDDERQLGTCTVKIAPKRLTDSMVGMVDRQSYTGKPIEPAISVADGNLLTTNDYTIVYSRNTDIGTATATIVGRNNYTGTITRSFAITVPCGGTVTAPAKIKVGQGATWKAKASAGSVFAEWEGPAVNAAALTWNERRNPTLKLTIPDGFDPAGVKARFVPVEEDGLHTIRLERTSFVCDEAVAFHVVDDSLSYVTAKVSGLPPGLKFDPARLLIQGTITTPGIYVVKIEASNASGYKWSENIAVTVADRTAPGFIDFSRLASKVEKGVPYAGAIGTDLRGTVKISGLPTGLRFEPTDGTVTGEPTKTGVYVVTVTQKFLNGMVKTATKTMTVEPWRVPEPTRTPYRALTLLCSADEGTVSGGGVYPEGKKVKITAKAAKGLVFAGWYQDSGYTRLAQFAAGDGQAAATTVVVPEATRLYARFVTVEAACASLAVTYGGQPIEKVKPRVLQVGVLQTIPVAATALSEAIVSVSGLPSGLKYDAKTGCIVGTVTRAVVDKMFTVKVKIAGRTAAYQMVVSAVELPVWATGSAFSGTGSVDGVMGASTLTVSAAGKISGKVTPVTGSAWTFSAAGFTTVTDGGTFVADVTCKGGKETRTAKLWLWAEEVAEGVLIGHYEIGGGTGTTSFVAEGWQSAFQRKDLTQQIPAVKGQIWTIETERGTLTLTGGAKGALTVRGTIDGVACSSSAQLMWMGENEQGEPICWTAVRLAAKGKFTGFVWCGQVSPQVQSETPAISDAALPPNVVTTTADVVDPYDGRISLREAFTRADEITFDLPAREGTTIVLLSALPIRTARKVIDGAIEQRLHGDIVTNRVTISGGGNDRLFLGQYGRSNVTFRNLILANGCRPTGIAPQSCGAVIQGTDWGTVTFENCLVRDNYAEGNGAVVDWYGSVIMRDSVFENNRADHMGGVVCLNGTGSVDVQRCTFTGNYSGTAGGVFRVDEGARVEDSVFENNVCADDGGVYFGDGNFTSSNSIYRGNSARYKGGVVFVYHWTGNPAHATTVTFLNCLLEQNRAPSGDPNVGGSGAATWTVVTTGSVFR